MQSKLMSLLKSQYGEAAEKLYEYATSASFISRFGDWTKQSKDNRLKNTYLTGEPNVDILLDYYYSDNALSIERNKEEQKKLKNTVVLSNSRLKDYQIEDAKESIFYFASEKFFEEYEKNHGDVNSKLIFDHAKIELEKLYHKTENKQQKQDLENVLREFNNVLPLVAEKFNQLGVDVDMKGIKIKEAVETFTINDDKVEGNTFENDLDSENEPDNDYEIGQVGVENAWAVNSFSINPTNTASTRLKIRLSRLPLMENGNQKFTYLGTPEFIDLDTAYTNLLRVVANHPDLTETQLMQLLEENNESQPWMKELKRQISPYNMNLRNMKREDIVKRIMTTGLNEEEANKNADARLKQEYQKYSQSEKNELLTYIKKAKADFYLTLWNRNKQGLIEGLVLNSNAQSTDRIVMDGWYENFKNSEIVEIKDGKLHVSKEKAEAVYDEYKRIVEITDKQLQVSELSKLLNAIGIAVKPSTIDKILKGSYFVKSKGVTNHKYLSNTKVFSFVEDDIISTKKDSYFNAIFSSFIKTTTSDENDENDSDMNYNPFEGSSSVVNYIRETLLKAYKEDSEMLFSDSHKDISGNNVYAYTQPKMVDNTFNRYAEGESDEAKMLIDQPFSKDNGRTSDFTDGMQSGKITHGYDEGLKKRNDDGGVDQVGSSEKEIALHRLEKLLNRGDKYRHVIGITISDKGKFGDIRIPAMELSYDAETGSSKNMDMLYNLAKAETKRIQDFKDWKGKTGNSDYETSSQLYHFFPLMNKEILLSSGLAEELGYKETDYNEDGSLHNEELMQRIVDKTLLDSIEERKQYWREVGMIEKVEYIGGKVKGLNIDAKWLNANKLNPLWTDRETGSKYINQQQVEKAYNQAALEYEFYNMYVLGEYYRNVGGDPANALKGRGGAASVIEGTKVEIIKRNAKDIAPGNELNWMVLNSEGKMEQSRSYNFAIAGDNTSSKIPIANDYIAAHPVLKNSYKSIERTDAQEYATGVEFLNTLFAAGKISDEFYKKIHSKLSSQEKSGVNETNKLDASELKYLILQAQKPVYVGDKMMSNGYVSKVYIKSSTFPLFPQLTQGLEIDKILQKMLKNDIQRLGFKTAVKLGRFNVTKIYNDDTGKLLDDFELVPVTLSRTGFRIQQEVPYDAKKAEIVFVSQMDKLITGDILNLEDFELDGQLLNGQQVRDKKEAVRIKIFELAKQELFRKLSISLETNSMGEMSYVFKDTKKIESFLKEEANSSTKLNINDELSIFMREDGQFEIPLFFNNSANKFESLLTSLVSKVVLNKISGKSYVQTTSNSWLNGTAEVLKQSGLVFTNNPNFDINKGLQTMRIVDRTTKKAVPGITSETFIKATPEQRKELYKKYEVLPAQVVVPFKFRDNEGNLLKLEDFLDKDGKVDYNKLPREVLRLIGARIPYQGHGSSSPIEIVGFLPIKSDTVIVPGEFTTQYGADVSSLLACIVIYIK